MLIEDSLVNKVTNSGIETIDLSVYYPLAENFLNIDFKKYLFMELILKEKDFREQLKNEDFSIYENKFIYITCSVDAVIPKWAFMLLTAAINPFTKNIFLGNKEEAINFFFTTQFLSACKPENFTDKRVVIKGCGETAISENAFMLATQTLLPFVKSLMYGEPCSTVPIFKKK